MVGKEIAVKKYAVRLSAEERAQLDELIRKGKRSAQLLTKARILLKADVSERGEGWKSSIGKSTSPLPKRRQCGRLDARGPAAEVANHRYRWLLRPQRHWPRRRAP